MAKINPIDVQKALGGVDYPARREDLVRHARENNASEEVMNFLEQIDEEREFDTPAEVQQEVPQSDQD